MRAKFRDHDLGNSGELTMEQMRDVLQELRSDAASAAENAAAELASARPATAMQQIMFKLE